MNLAVRVNRRFILMLFVCLALVLTACRRGDGGGGPTLQPTLTPTPRSTPLPAIDPTPVPGSEDNPIRFVVVRPPTGTDRQINTAATNLAEALSEESSLVVTVDVVDSAGEAVAALCDAVGGVPTAAFLNGIAYAVANAQGCGSAALIGRRGSGNSATTAETVQIIVNENVGFTGLGGLLDPAVEFCRLGFDDLNSWLVPILIMEAANVQPTAIANVVDYEDEESLIQAVADGDCAAAGVAQSQYEDIADASARAVIDVLGSPVDIPYQILAYPLEVPLGARLILNEALLDYTDSSLRTLLGVDRMIRLTDDSLTSFNAFLRRTGIDFATFGG